jgi:hypothetical protein
VSGFIYQMSIKSLIVGVSTPDPTVPPSISMPIPPNGSMVPGNYSYVYTYVTGWGETVPSPASLPFASIGSLRITVPTAAGVNEINIYRSNVGAAPPYRFLHTIHLGSDQLYFIDSVPDGLLGAVAPTTNTTISRNEVIGSVSTIYESKHSITISAAGVDAATAPITPMALVVFMQDTDGVAGIKLPRDVLLLDSQMLIKNIGADIGLIYPYEAPGTINGVPSIELGPGETVILQIVGTGPLAWTSLTFAQGTGSSNRLSTLYDVQLGGLVTGDVLVYNAPMQKWINAEPTLPVGTYVPVVSNVNDPGYIITPVLGRYVNYGSVVNVTFTLTTDLTVPVSSQIIFDMTLPVAPDTGFAIETDCIGHASANSNTSTNPSFGGTINAVVSELNPRAHIVMGPVISPYTDTGVLSGSFMYDII